MKSPPAVIAGSIEYARAEAARALLGIGVCEREPGESGAEINIVVLCDEVRNREERREVRGITLYYRFLSTQRAAAVVSAKQDDQLLFLLSKSIVALDTANAYAALRQRAAAILSEPRKFEYCERVNALVAVHDNARLLLTSKEDSEPSSLRAARFVESVLTCFAVRCAHWHFDSRQRWFALEQAYPDEARILRASLRGSASGSEISRVVENVSGWPLNTGLSLSVPSRIRHQPVSVEDRAPIVSLIA